MFVPCACPCCLRVRVCLFFGMLWQSKVAPPSLKGKKVGVFATRSPHRPNPVGVIVGACVRWYRWGWGCPSQGCDTLGALVGS